MRYVIRRISPVRTRSHAGKGTADKIVDHRDPLRGKPETYLRHQYVVVYQSRSVTYFNEQILRHHAAFQLLYTLWPLIVMQIIAAYPCALCFPVAPYAHRAVMDVISPDGDIYGRMHLYPCDLRATELHHIIYMMDMVVFNDAEDTAHAPDDASLLAVVYVVAAYDMAAYVLFEPSVILPAAYGISLHLRRALDVSRCKIVVVIRIIVSSERDPGTLAVHDLTVFYDPAFAPVRSDHSILKGCGRCPRSCGFLHPEAPDRYVVSSGFRRPEALPADIDLNLFAVRIRSVKVRVYHGLIAFPVLLRIPFKHRLFRIPADIADLSADAVFEAGCLIHGLIVQVHASGMLICLCKIPVSVDKRRVRIAAAEHTVAYSCDPDITGVSFPRGYPLRTRNDRSQRFSADIGYPVILSSGIQRIHLFTINAGGHKNCISRFCMSCRFVYSSERPCTASVTVRLRVYVYINIHLIHLSCFQSVPGRPARYTVSLTTPLSEYSFPIPSPIFGPNTLLFFMEYSVSTDIRICTIT